ASKLGIKIFALSKVSSRAAFAERPLSFIGIVDVIAHPSIHPILVELREHVGVSEPHCLPDFDVWDAANSHPVVQRAGGALQARRERALGQ
ncbi:MAG: hypothetical protein ABI233_03550, partial [Chthoniobacterales bacterium]